ncbi:hypothetical protein CRG98_021901, partial [Punica granatum]
VPRQEPCSGASWAQQHRELESPECRAHSTLNGPEGSRPSEARGFRGTRSRRIKGLVGQPTSEARRPPRLEGLYGLVGSRASKSRGPTSWGPCKPETSKGLMTPKARDLKGSAFKGGKALVLSQGLETRWPQPPIELTSSIFGPKR